MLEYFSNEVVALVALAFVRLEDIHNIVLWLFKSTSKKDGERIFSSAVRLWSLTETPGRRRTGWVAVFQSLHNKFATIRRPWSMLSSAKSCGCRILFFHRHISARWLYDDSTFLQCEMRILNIQHTLIIIQSPGFSIREDINVPVPKWNYWTRWYLCTRHRAAT